jgi:phosphoglucosamine mutase
MQEIFGTDGIRTQIGKEPLTAPKLLQLASAIGKWLTTEKKNASLALGYDTRYSSALCKASLKAGLLQYPIKVTDCSITPTPVLQQYVTAHNYDLGIMITASHNKACDNGIKLFTANGKISKTDQAIITQLFHEDTFEVDYDNLGQEIHNSMVQAWNLERLATFFKKNFLQGITIVLDYAHGAYWPSALQVFESFGATVISLHNNPNGKNINEQCGSLYPQELQKAVIAHQAAIGFAFDGDGDRVIIVNQDGVIKDGDDILGFLQLNPYYSQQTTAVTTVMANQGLVEYFKSNNKTLLQTPVGDTFVIEKLKEHKLLLGAEPSGHVILGDNNYISDGLFTALRVCQTALLVKNFKVETFEKFPQIMINVPVSCKKDLTQWPFCQVIEEHQKMLTKGRVLVRYSGTEPLLRIMIETVDAQEAHKIANLLSTNLINALQNKENQ